MYNVYIAELQKLYNSNFKPHMYFLACIQINAYVIQVSILCRQYSYSRYDIVSSHQNQIQYFHVIPSQHLLLEFHTGVFHKIHC